MIIEIKDLVKEFDHHKIFDRFNLEVEQGELIALTGPSGSGKSTLLNILGLIDNFDSGSYRLFDEENIKVNSKRAGKIIRERISYLFQNFALIDSATVEDNLLMALKYRKESRQAKKKIITQSLKSVGLDGYEGKKVFSLSGGEQQRVAIARVLIKQSDLVLADEPTGSLDSKNRNEVLELLMNIHKEGKTVIIVTHDQFVADSCQRVISIG
ncbi:ABC transporter ATP-binding protein [Xylocopilactobacillus apicola]|uniref:ABC transporter ATP-binding protein n=1 Tax=Xylocopilactobacillus apicola TaxID=2932184 RepID=A0AAU9D6N6_9LACO|nr:ABC transporter ATP-binding protein [Xylocopilactobacillus apicola]